MTFEERKLVERKLNIRDRAAGRKRGRDLLDIDEDDMEFKSAKRQRTDISALTGSVFPSLLLFLLTLPFIHLCPSSLLFRTF
jgi:hypothetical protein